MKNRRKLLLALSGSVLGLALIACSFSSLNPLIATPTTQTGNTSSSGGNTPSSGGNTSSTGTAGYTSLPYYDDFSDPSSGWDVYSDDHVDEGYNNGYYFLISKTTDYIEDAYANKWFMDTVIEVDATPVAGIGQDYFDYGLSCRVQSNYIDGYDFIITTDGYFAVYKVSSDGDTTTSLLQGDEYQETNAVLQGYQTNHLKVTCDRSHLKFEVNGTTLYDGTDTEFLEGDIRFSTSIYENINNEVDFDNLSVVAP